MWPVNRSPATEAGATKQSEVETEMIRIHCQEKIKAKSSTAKRHLQCKHPSSLTSTLTAVLEPDKLVKLASY